MPRSSGLPSKSCPKLQNLERAKLSELGAEEIKEKQGRKILPHSADLGG
jgi:hypothetical protein